jgi:hypothetical protein
MLEQFAASHTKLLVAVHMTVFRQHIVRTQSLNCPLLYFDVYSGAVL